RRRRHRRVRGAAHHPRRGRGRERRLPRGRARHGRGRRPRRAPRSRARGRAGGRLPRPRRGRAGPRAPRRSARVARDDVGDRGGERTRPGGGHRRHPHPPRRDGAPPARALDELAVLRRPRLQVTLALAVLVNSATFGTLTFLAVLATSRAGLPEALTPGLLAAFGVGAFGGVTAAGRLGDRYGPTAVGLGTPLLVVGWLAMVPGSTDGVAIWLLTALL